MLVLIVIIEEGQEQEKGWTHYLAARLVQPGKMRSLDDSARRVQDVTRHRLGLIIFHLSI